MFKISFGGDCFDFQVLYGKAKCIHGLPLASTMNHPFDESKHNIMVHYKNCACCFTISAVVKLTF